MIKWFIQHSISLLLKNPKLIRVAFLMTFGHTIAYVYLIAYFFNGSIRMKYDVGVDTSSFLIYMFNTIQKLDVWRIIILFVLIILVWYFWIYPVGEASIIYSVKENGGNLSKALHQWFKKFFHMLEYRSMNSFLWVYTIVTVAIRLWVMGVLNSFIIKPVLVIWCICSLFTIIFWPYFKYYIVLEDCSPFDAMVKSVMLTLGNIRLTLKGLFYQLCLTIRFFIVVILLMVIPIWLLYGAVKTGIIANSFVEWIVWSLLGLLLLFIVYLNGMFEAFMASFWYKLFQQAEKNLN